MEYANAEAKIKARVEAGEVSKEAAEKRLYKMREQFAGDRSDQGKESRTFTREEYARAKKRIDGMVLEGEVSREDADTRLGEMRRRIATDKRESGEVNWDGLKRRIEHAVEAGDLTDEALEGIKKRIEGTVEAGGMTREEADALYEKLEKSE
jgi:polyhydroxyalkanoate synthesis regulator phasin